MSDLQALQIQSLVLWGVTFAGWCGIAGGVAQPSRSLGFMEFIIITDRFCCPSPSLCVLVPISGSRGNVHRLLVGGFTDDKDSIHSRARFSVDILCLYSIHTARADTRIKSSHLRSGTDTIQQHLKRLSIGHPFSKRTSRSAQVARWRLAAGFQSLRGQKGSAWCGLAGVKSLRPQPEFGVTEAETSGTSPVLGVSRVSKL